MCLCISSVCDFIEKEYLRLRYVNAIIIIHAQYPNWYLNYPLPPPLSPLATYLPFNYISFQFLNCYPILHSCSFDYVQCIMIFSCILLHSYSMIHLASLMLLIHNPGELFIPIFTIFNLLVEFNDLHTYCHWVEAELQKVSG